MIHIVRMGTHAEKDYLLMGARWFDEVLFNANLLEGTLSATSLLAFKLGQQGRPFSIDPITYAFGVNPRYIQAENVRGELKFKRTFVNLARKLGIVDQSQPRLLTANDFNTPSVIEDFARRTISYQFGTVQQALESNADFIDDAAQEVRPARLFAPYFHMSTGTELASVNARLAMASSDFSRTEFGRGIWIILCVDGYLIEDGQALSQIIRAYADVSCDGMGLWITGFNEQRASLNQIHGLISLVKALREAHPNVPIVQLYGGYFSALLECFGIGGISHGVGYGEQRDVTPVVGGGLPPARYYLPAIHEEISIVELVTLVRALSLDEASFQDRICHCVICRGLLRGGVEALLSAFSESERRPYGRGYRDIATPTVYRMARFHFLQNRSEELRHLSTLSVPDLDQLSRAFNDYAFALSNPPTFLLRWRMQVEEDLN